MLKLLIRKIIQGTLMILIVSAVTFVLLSAAGGDALTSLRDNPQVTEETIQELRRVYGLDRPIAVRFASWLGGAVTGDLGSSLAYRIPVSRLILSRLMQTIYLALAAILFAASIAALFSCWAARAPSKALDLVIEAIVLTTSSLPRIVFAILALALSAALAARGLQTGTGSALSFVFAAVVLAWPLIAIFLAQWHEQLKAAMKEDFVAMARAKGLSETALILRHASRATLNPILTLLGLSIGGLLGGSVIVETILGWPGIGALTVSAVKARDVPLVMGIVLVTSLAVWLGNAAAELLQTVNDKRLRDRT